MVGQYIKCLSRYGLWPVSNIRFSSISKISSLLEDPGPGKDASAGQEYMNSVLRAAVSDVDSKVTGLFLFCVRDVIHTEINGEYHADWGCCCLSKDSTQQSDESPEGH